MARRAPETIAWRDDLIAERDPRRPSAWLLRQRDMDASYVDLADPSHLEFDYLRWIRMVLWAGRAHIARQATGAWDAVVIDAFIGAAVPRRLITVEALADVARVAPLVLINVVDNRAARDVRTVAAAAAEAYPRVWTLGGRAGNTVVVGALAALDLGKIAAAIAADTSPARLTPPEATGRLIAGTAPLHDAAL